MKIIMISGKAEHGKTESASYLQYRFETIGKRVLRINFAQHLKFIAREYLGWDGQKNEEGRRILQWFGTDVVRAKYPDFWVNSVKDTVMVLDGLFDIAIIDDCRFPNELNAFPDSTSIRVVRLNHENKLTAEQRMHPSETALDDCPHDFHVVSPNNLDELRYRLDRIFVSLPY